MSIGTQKSLQKYARPLFVSSATSDKDVPFSYKDWISAFQGVIPGQEFRQYNEYLVNWYKDKSTEVTDTKLQIRLNYLTLLKQLQLFFSREEAENWYNKVDITNDKELLLAIPYFAKKLKDIALYYLQLRDAIKESRLKYNQAGTSTGIVQQIQKFLITNYTQKPNSSIAIPAFVWRDVPELSAIKDSITVEIEELYDFKNYFDQSPSLPVSAYFNVNNLDLQSFLTTKGLTISSTEWIYKIGANPLSADYISLSGEDLTEIAKQIAEKYLGQDKYTSLAPNISSRQDFYNISLETGNNFFYWPIGIYRTKAKTNPRYNSVLLTESGLDTVATAGSSLEFADTIFTQTTRGIEGAWFRNELYDYKPATMKAIIDANKKTIFRFPFPGYGLSAEDIEWTGFGLTTNTQFFFLNDDLQKNVESTYWSSSTDLSAITPLLINDTTLVDSKSYANRDYTRADKIKVLETPPGYNTEVFNGDSQDAWLYRMNNTDISVQTAGDSVIVWPYEKINPDDTFPSYYPKNISNICSPTPVSGINFQYAVAGDALSSSDVIYKLSNYKDTKDLALECCWLSGSSYGVSNTKIQGIQQSSLQLVLSSGNYTKFVWNGINDTDVNTVFKTRQHQPNCKFANTNNASYLDFNLCDCKQVLFTPFGHPGTRYSDNNGFADFIIEDNFSPNKLDLSTWKDAYNTLYTASSGFCWYRTNSNIGWGNGRWYSGSLSAGNTFYLQKGKAYIYYRASVTKEDKEEITLPEYVIRCPYNSSNQIWIRAFKNDNNEWVSSNTPSPFILNPGDIILYQRIGTTFYNLTGAILETIDVSENRGSIWTSFDYISIGQDKSFVLSYPIATYTNPTALNTANPAYPQYPALNINNLVSVLQWSVSAPGQPLQVFRNVPSVIINPSLTGLYTFAITAMSAASLPPQAVQTGTTFSYTAGTTGIFIFTSIPPVTAISNQVFVPSLTSYTAPVPGYVINTPLRGWDYNTATSNPFARIENSGARPYWAKLYTEKDENTNFRGINAIGTPQRFVDRYNIISQPEISDITLRSGTYIEYTRNYPINLVWLQPVDFIITVNKNTWCTLNFETTSLSNLVDQLANYKNELVVTPTTATSNLLLQSFIDNEPTEIFYNAINPFIWSITATPEFSETIFQQPTATLTIEALRPWANLPNQFYPTVAAFPDFEELYSSVDVGGYFTPSNLGATIYVDQDYTANLNISSAQITKYFEDAKRTLGGRGLTKEDQTLVYRDIIENNIWLKEPTVAGPIAGTTRKSVFKNYQKFLPYQSAYESNRRQTIGLLTPTSRQSPWTGKEDSEWGDLQNKPTTFTGEVNTSLWANSQVLKQTGLQIDNWGTDIFGNQYGVYKNLKNVAVYDRKNISGEIWVRKNSQLVLPAYEGLKNVFDTYTNTNLINELTGLGVKKIDIFFDTLLVETSGTVIFEKINYDYNNDDIFSVADEARYLSLAIPVSTSLTKEFLNTNLSVFDFAKAGETWFFPNEKLIVQSVCGLKNFIITPELYQLDLSDQSFKKLFPETQEDIITIQSLSSLNLVSIEPPVLSYNSLRKEYLLTLLGKNNSNKNVVVEFKIKNLIPVIIDTITVYSPTPDTAQLNPPIINQSLNVTLNISTIEYINALNFQVIAENGPVVFEKVSGPDWVGLTPDGLFFGTPPLQTTKYNILFKVSNSAGPVYYSLLITVNYTEITAIYYLTTEGYFLDDGFILQEPDDGRIIE